MSTADNTRVNDSNREAPSPPATPGAPVNPPNPGNPAWAVAPAPAPNPNPSGSPRGSGFKRPGKLGRTGGPCKNVTGGKEAATLVSRFKFKLCSVTRGPPILELTWF